MRTSLHSLWTASIARQLMLGIALVHAVLMTIFVFDLVSRQRAFLVDESSAQAIALAETLAANGTSWVLSRDFVGIEEVIESQGSFPGLRYAMFLDRRGQVLGYTDRTQVGRYVSDATSLVLIGARPESRTLIDRSLLVDAASPILADGRHLGWARVGIGREGIAANLDVVTREGLLYTAIAIGAGILFARLMAGGLTRDIRRLASFADHVRTGEREERAALARPDELGALARDMNRMVDTLAERERELTQVHERIKADEERLRYALEGSNDGLWDWDLTRNSVYMSPRWKDMLGLGDQEIDGTFDTWRTRVHPEDLPKALAALEAHLEDCARPFEILHRLRHRDGDWRWILSRGRALRDAEGRPVRMVGTHVDVTLQKRLEQVLTEERERALVTLSSIGDGVITARADGRVEYLNPVAESLTGWGTAEAQGRPLSEIFPVIDETSRKPVPDPVERCLREDRNVGSRVESC